MPWLRLKKIFSTRKPRGEIRFVDYAEGDRLIRTGDWKLAIPEEDHNHTFNRVYVEKTQP